MKASIKSLFTSRAFLIYITLMLAIRFWNFHEASYFIFDVGRDAIVLRDMAAGDLKLIGQTTGIPGLFYGPLWYYVGLPGYFMFGGNPYGIQAWYVLIASLALPLYWHLSRQLFSDRRWAVLSAVLLGISPGGITGTNFVWNVMLATPLLAASLIFLTKRSPTTKDWIGAFACMGFILQAEFAYAIFLISITMLVSFWSKQGFRFKQAIYAVLAVGVTATPLIMFELLHKFSMTKSVIANIGEQGKSVSLQYIFQQRPPELWQATLHFFSRAEHLSVAISLMLAACWIAALIKIFRSKDVRWYRILLVAVIPYGMFMIWTGNYGYFFEYYLTPHFIPLTVLLILGLQTIYQTIHKHIHPHAAVLAITFASALLAHASFSHLDGIILRPQNNAGLRAMQQAVEKLYEWSDLDDPDQVVFRIYTPNLATENYDYLTTWISESQDRPHPSTVASEDDQYRYMLYEPDYHNRSDRFLPWLEESTQGYEQLRSEQIGVLTVETWKKI